MGQTKEIEEFLKEHATFYTDNVKLAPVREILKERKVRQISEGWHTVVSEIEGSNWIVKEARWGLAVGKYFFIPAVLFGREVNFFSLSFSPNQEQTLNQYETYLNVVDYFGYFSKADSYFHPELEEIKRKQKQIRGNLINRVKDIEEYYRFKFSERELYALNALLKDETAQYNFLPKEYLLFGASNLPESNGANTYYIFQERVAGKLIHDISFEEITQTNKKQLILFSFLLLLLNLDTGLVLDTRPRNILLNVTDWYLKTDNIIMSQSEMKFIDTRWPKVTNEGIIKQGIFIASSTLLQARTVMKKYLREINIS